MIMARKAILGMLILYSISMFAYILSQYISKEESLSTTEVALIQANNKRSVQIKGLDVSNYNFSTFKSRIRINNLEIRPRKFSIFRIKSINELLLKDVHLEVHSKPEKSKEEGSASSFGGQLFKSFNNLDQLIEFGAVQRIVFVNFTYRTMIAETKLPKQTVTADQAIYDVKKKVMTMKNAKVELFSLHKRLTAPELIWDEKKQIWRVKKNAILSDKAQKITLEEQALNQDLELID